MKTIIRTGIIEIDSLKANGHQWISTKIQHNEVDENGAIVSELYRSKRMLRRVDAVALEQVTIIDPVTQVECTLSVAGIGTAIKAMMANWMIEDYDAHYDPELDAVVLNDSNS